MEEKEIKETKEVDKKSLGYRMGELFGATCIFVERCTIFAPSFNQS